MSFIMKNFKFIFLLLTIFFLNSCSDTVVLQETADGSVDAPPVSGYFKKRVLIEDYTGTWCGNCARVAYAIGKVFEDPDNKAVAVAIHNGNDPYHFEGYLPLKELISPDNDLQLPQSRLNRTIVWTAPEALNVQQVKNLTGNNCGLGLAMNTQVLNGNVTLDVKIKFVENYSDLKLVVYLLEDNLLYNQTNYSTYFGNVNPVVNFDHNHVLRASLTNVLGDAITENASIYQTITKTFSVPVPSDVANAENINFVAFIVDSNNLVINVRAAHANENQDFEVNP
jgi:hypothetical protein